MTAAANVIDGGAGADTMAGGLGNDTYVVDDAGDVITEALPAALTWSRPSITYSLAGSNLENLTLTGFWPTSMPRATPWPTSSPATRGDNRLDGGAGVDTMVGGLGDDTYVVDVSG